MEERRRRKKKYADIPTTSTHGVLKLFCRIHQFSYGTNRKLVLVTILFPIFYFMYFHQFCRIHQFSYDTNRKLVLVTILFSILFFHLFSAHPPPPRIPRVAGVFMYLFFCI